MRLVLVVSLSILAASPLRASRNFQRRAAELIQAHKGAAHRLDPPVAATLHALLAGSHFYVGDDAWGSEARGRAGGMTGILKFDPDTAQPGDVVWLAYDNKTLPDVFKIATQAERHGCVVVLFGPKPLSREPFHLWVDSLNASQDDVPLTLFANVMSLWEAQGELIGAASRSGKRIAVNVTYLLPESRLGFPQGTMFDDKRSALEPIPPNVMAAGYLDTVQQMLRSIDQKQSKPLHAAAQLIAASLSSRKTVVYTSVGHLMQVDGAHSSRRFVYQDSSASAAEYLQQIGKAGGVVLYLGYVPAEQPFEAAAGLRKSGIPIVWSGVPPAKLAAWVAPGEIFIDQGWVVGDCAIRGHGSPCMLAVSGISELYLLERLRDLSGDSRQ